MEALTIPVDRNAATVEAAPGRPVALTNLDKVFFPERNLRKRDLLQYYADVAPLVVRHVRDRPMVLKRYPNGIGGEFFYMKRTPANHPAWLRTCAVEHGSGNVIDFPVVDDVAGLLWVINLGCIDLNEWYSRCDDTDRPDYLHFDLDPVVGADFATVRTAALCVRDGLLALGMQPRVKTSGSKGMHVYVAIERGPVQKEVWTFAKAFAQTLERMHPEIITAEYRVAKRPPGRVLVDYNQNAWGQTLASVYSVRARPLATVSTPVTWEEVEAGIELDDFRLDTVRERFAKLGDLWAPLADPAGRFDLRPLLAGVRVPERRKRATPSA
jgi:bifunctional non-homologous end joining protein LigD